MRQPWPRNGVARRLLRGVGLCLWVLGVWFVFHLIFSYAPFLSELMALDPEPGLWLIVASIPLVIGGLLLYWTRSRTRRFFAETAAVTFGVIAVFFMTLKDPTPFPPGSSEAEVVGEAVVRELGPLDNARQPIVVWLIEKPQRVGTTLYLNGIATAGFKLMDARVLGRSPGGGWSPWWVLMTSAGGRRLPSATLAIEIDGATALFKVNQWGEQSALANRWYRHDDPVTVPLPRAGKTVLETGVGSSVEIPDWCDYVAVYSSTNRVAFVEATNK